MTTIRKIAHSTLLLALCSTAFGASKTVVPTTVPDPDPQVEQKSFKIADGFQINLFATDPMIEKPIQMNWDPKGRLWCATSATYPQLAPGQVPNDKVYILEDTTGSGKADKSTVFADGLFLPNAVIPGDGGAYVTNSTEIVHLKDTKGTGKADTRRVIFAGFGTEDTHHIVHTLRWGPDGRLYFMQSIYIHSHLETPHGLKTLLGSGAWRCDTRTLNLEVYSRGLVNPWGLQWDYWGQTFETDGAGGEGINYAFPGASFQSAVGMEKLLPGLNPHSPKYASEEILSGSHLPDDYQGDILTNDFRASRIVRFKLSDNGAGYTSKQMPDFLTSTDLAFRPVDIKMGPDGAIYIADWYNPIIQHGEVDFRDSRRDHTHGRIWRVTATNRPLVARPKLDGASIPQLLEFLKAPEGWTRTQAKLVLRERDPAEVLPALKTWLNAIKSTDPQADHDRLEGLWVCENLNTVDQPLLEQVLKSADSHARAAAIRVVGHWAGQLSEPLKLLEPMVVDEYPRARLEAVRALAQIPTSQAIVLATRALQKPTDTYLDYALWLTCNELQPVWMPAYESGKLAGWAPDEQNFALRAVGSPAALKALVDQLKDEHTPADVRKGLIDRVTQLAGQPEVVALFDLALATPDRDPQAKTDLLSALVQISRTQGVKPPAHLERLDVLIGSSDESVRAAALRLGGAWKRIPLRPQLLDALQAPNSSDTIRSAAADGLALLGDRETTAQLSKLASSPGNPRVREAALIALTQLDLRSAVGSATALLSKGDADPGPVLAAFLRRDGGAEALGNELQGKPIPADTAKLALRYLRGASTQDPKLIEVFSAASGVSGAPVRLSADQMKQTVDQVLASGNAANGEKIFRRAESSCYLCHSIAGAGGWLAPDISSIGASSPVDYLINSVLDPNKDIKDGFDGVAVVTKSGDVFNGIKIGQDKTSLILKDNAHPEIHIALSDIKLQKSIGSLMPSGLTDTMTHQEFVDLVRFLSELGKPGPYASSPAQYIRRWRVIDGLPKTGSIAPVAGDDGAPAYSLVSGALPADAISGKDKTVGYVRGEINVTAPGKVRLLLNDPKGLTLLVDGKATPIGAEVPVALSAGIHSLTFGVDLKARGDEGLKVEVADVPGSTGHAQSVGGR
jgi:putative heme-binding domain-containing protein